MDLGNKIKRNCAYCWYVSNLTCLVCKLWYRVFFMNKYRLHLGFFLLTPFFWKNINFLRFLMQVLQYFHSNFLSLFLKNMYCFPLLLWILRNTPFIYLIFHSCKFAIFCIANIMWLCVEMHSVYKYYYFFSINANASFLWFYRENL
jgi:hypothetical protein